MLIDKDVMNNLSTKKAGLIGSDWFDLRSLFYELLLNKWLIIGVTMVTLALGVLVAYQKQPQYQATLLMQVVNNQHSPVGMISNLSSHFNLGSSEDPSAMQVALIRSRFILNPVIKSLGIDISALPKEMPIIGHFFPDKNLTIRINKLQVPHHLINQPLSLIVDKSNRFHVQNADKKVLVQGNVGQLLKSQDQTFAIQVDALSAPQKTEFTLIKHSDVTIIEKLISRLKIVDLGLTAGNAHKTGILQLSLTGPDANQIVNILNAIAATVRTKDMEKKSLEAEKTLEFLTQQLPLVKASLEEAEAKLNHYRAKTGKIDIKLQTQYLLTHLSDLDKQLETIRLNRMEMLQKNTASHPFIIALNQKDKQLTTERTRLYGQLSQLPESDQVAVNLMRDVKVKNELYLLLLNKMQELQVIKAGTVSDIRILSLASLPDQSLPRGRVLITIASVIFGLMLSTLIIFIRKLLFHHVDDPYWLERNGNIVNLAIVPYSTRQASNILTLNLNKNKYVPLLAAAEPHDYSIESLRSLRTSFQMMCTQAKNNIIAILGISPGIGKSFVSANFAYLLADIGKKVLLIDGDFRRGHLQQYFSTARTPGVTEIINQTVTLKQAIVQDKHQHNLHFLPTGVLPKNPSELIMTSAFKQFIHDISQQYDYIVIDTSPVLAVTDGALIGALSGTNFLIVGAKVHQAEEIDLAVKRFSNAGISLQGYIFNHVRSESKTYGYSRYHYYYTYDKKDVK